MQILRTLENIERMVDSQTRSISGARDARDNSTSEYDPCLTMHRN